MSVIKIGVATFQGDVEEHVAATRGALTKMGVDGEVLLVKTPEEVSSVDALILPGGESTVIGKLSAYSGAMAEVRKRLEEGLPALGTCAGLIMLASRVYDRVIGKTNQQVIGILDVTVERNSYGRQRESFETTIEVSDFNLKEFRAVFIRAPTIIEVGPRVQVLATFNERPVAVRQSNIIGTTFHPELSGSTAFHERLVDLALSFSKK